MSIRHEPVCMRSWVQTPLRPQFLPFREMLLVLYMVVSCVVTLSRSFPSSTAKAKTAKPIRNLLSLFNGIPNSQQTRIAVPNDNIDWAKREKRLFL
ncbi:hypothetical protein BJV78DRAFT_1241256, partial [Lactifluus subvellereus]